MRRLRPCSLNRLAALSGAAFLALLGLVWAGAFTSLDHYAVSHLMPWAEFGPAKLIRLRTVFRPETRSTLGGTLVALWTYPASPFISALIVAVCAWRLPRRTGLIVIGLWVVANAIELAGKVIVSRPSVGQPGFAHSFPSGHTVRAFVVAAILAWTWRRAAAPALLWALGVAVALVAIGDHVPTDVAGGALLAAFLVFVAENYVSRFSGGTELAAQTR